LVAVGTRKPSKARLEASRRPAKASEVKSKGIPSTMGQKRNQERSGSFSFEGTNSFNSMFEHPGFRQGKSTE